MYSAPNAVFHTITNILLFVCFLKNHIFCLVQSVPYFLHIKYDVDLYFPISSVSEKSHDTRVRNYSTDYIIMTAVYATK